MSYQNEKVVLAERPKGIPDPAKTWRYEKGETYTEESLKEGQVLVKNEYFSCDPAMRGWIDDNPRSYVAPIELGAVMRSNAAGKVIASKASNIKVGDWVKGVFGWQRYAVADAKTMQVIDVNDKISVEDHMGTLGSTGMTAYFGLQLIEPETGKTLVVSAAGGATGTAVVQLGKIWGMKVIAIAGRDDKLELLKKLGADKTFNYKSKTFDEDFLAYTDKDGIDRYFDNVGGHILDLVMSRVNKDARIAACGAISKYNSDKSEMTNWNPMFMKRVHVRGFICTDFRDEWPKAIKEMEKYMEEGKLQSVHEAVDTSMADIPKVFLRLFSGDNTGKLMAHVA